MRLLFDHCWLAGWLAAWLPDGRENVEHTFISWSGGGPDCFLLSVYLLESAIHPYSNVYIHTPTHTDGREDLQSPKQGLNPAMAHVE